MSNFPQPQPFSTGGTPEPRPPRPAPKGGSGSTKLVIFGCLGCFGLAVLAVIVTVAGLAWMGTRPAMSVQTGSTLPASDLQRLQDNGLLEDGETLEQIYTQGMLSFEQDTFFFTDRKVGYYWRVDDASTYELAEWDRVVNIEWYESQSFIEDSTIVVTLADGSEIMGLVQHIDDEDRRFYNGMLRAWEAAGGVLPEDVEIDAFPESREPDISPIVDDASEEDAAGDAASESSGGEGSADGG